MVALGWILRILAVLLLIRLLMRFVAGLREGLSGGAPARSGSGQPKQSGTRVGGRLVRDPQCGTHVPEARAVRLGSGDQAVYFCSTACRDQWTTARRAS